MAINTRASVVGVKAESTEGTPVRPAGATDFVAIQDDFSISPEIELLENAELKNSLGPAKGITGTESPTASFGYYLRHSGVEGQAPVFGSTVLKAAFGSEDVEATEYDTVAASTTTVVKVDAGEGATFRRGQALLVKDSTNGYAIRPVHSIATDDLSVGFALGAAPASGVNLGKAVTYYPADSGHQSLSVWHYLGNGGATQMVAGCRVTDISWTMEAGQLINSSVSLAGIGYYFDPLEVTASNKYFDFDEGSGEVSTSIPVGWYDTPHKLAAAIQTAVDAAATATVTCVYSDVTGKFTLASDGVTFSILWKTGTHGSDGTDTHIGSLIGFLDTADDTGSVSYISDSAISLAAPYTPSFDSSDPLVAKSNQLFIGDQDDAVCINASSISIALATPKADIPSICSASGVSGSLVSSRSVTISVTALLDQYDADKMRRYKDNVETRFAYIFGEKSGGNWVPGKCGCFYAPTCTVSSVNISDADGLAILEMELTTFVNDSGEGEFYLSFV